ncbi:unnamed protein product [Dracunculus medinensis]|uniref:Ephrin RBD domain-containing protein n=1 Tax=Dracunculus medinensis TaxID=318479 RepID=A0A0N4UKS3_DRAME|nr:unnamed protein product [Dracunculus medinensis]
MDSLVIHCPTYNDSMPKNKTERMIIYRVKLFFLFTKSLFFYMTFNEKIVSRFGYDNCVLDETAQIVGRCNNPHIPITIKIVFREFTPLPSGLEYSPGTTYFFISTSTGNEQGIDQIAGGLCFLKQMRLRIHIHPTSKKGFHQYFIQTSSLFFCFTRIFIDQRRHRHHGVKNSKDIITTTVLPKYWNEFLNKLRPKDSLWNNKNSAKNHFGEALTLDMSFADNSALTYERDDAISEALRFNPNIKLYEIHETDDCK